MTLVVGAEFKTVQHPHVALGPEVTLGPFDEPFHRFTHFCGNDDAFFHFRIKLVHPIGGDQIAQGLVESVSGMSLAPTESQLAILESGSHHTHGITRAVLDTGHFTQIFADSGFHFTSPSRFRFETDNYRNDSDITILKLK